MAEELKQAAQTERDAMAEKFEAMHTNGDVWISTIAAAKLTRASLPSPQQATPEPVGEVVAWTSMGQIRFTPPAQDHDTYTPLCRCVSAKPDSAHEPAAWRTFDGEGGYEFRAYTDNETYADEWAKRNPNHKGWVDALYTRPAPGVPDWTECLRISEAPDVDEALRLFAEGETSEDQAVCIVRAVIEAYLKSKHGNV